MPAVRFRSDLFVNDYAGHAFTVELARALRSRGCGRIGYGYCSSNVSPKGQLDDGDFVVPIPAGQAFEKYRLSRRVLSELRYGLNTARVLWRRRPAIHVVCNMPLVALFVAWLASLPLRCRLVVWLQDAQAGLVAGVLGDGFVSRSLQALERLVLRRARPVIAISEELATEARRLGAQPDNVVVMENWAPIEALPRRPRCNAWAISRGLVDRSVVLYSGTLARKHRADLLLELAQRTRTRADVVVVSEGEGADWLAAQASAGDVGNLVVLPYQPFGELPDVLATADVLVVLLEPNAGRFSVPSKVLSYLCAGRPIVGAMPRENTAARIVESRSDAGLIVPPDDVDAFCAAVSTMLESPELRARAGANGRAYAEAHFRAEHVVALFEAALGLRDRPAHQGYPCPRTK